MVLCSCKANLYKQIKRRDDLWKQNLTITTNESKEIFVIDSRIWNYCEVVKGEIIWVKIIV